MSWMFSIIGNFNNETLKRVKSFLPTESDIYTFKNKILMSVANNNQTSFSGKFNAQPDYFWSVVGQGISKMQDSYKFMDKQDWMQYLHSDNDSSSDLNGHYICSVISGDRAIFFNDTLGIRDFYLAKIDNLFILSTRLNFISKFTGYHEIDYGVFGSGWLLENRISTASIIKNICRFTSGSKLEFNFTESEPTLTISEKKWLPVNKESLSADSVINRLIRLTTFPTESGKKIAFGLSGGLDSRVLFSILKGTENFRTFTFGNAEHPDSVIAAKVAGTYSIPHEVLDEPPVFDRTNLTKLFEFAASNQATSPLSEYFQKKYIDRCFAPNEVMIDGGFGEILRRGLFNKLQYFWSKNLSNPNFLSTKDALSFFNNIKIKRADIFSDEINQLMEESSIRQIEQLFDEMPRISDFGIENWLDLLSIRTKLINYCSIEQMRGDEFCLGFNPFSQPELLNDIFSLNLGFRKNAVLFNQIIKSYTPEIRKIPLVKGNLTIPFGQNTLIQKTIAKTKLKLGLSFKDQSSERFLDAFKEMISDTVNSQSVKQNPIYNPLKIFNAVTGYYQGKKGKAREIDWWLSFHFFNEGLING